MEVNSPFELLLSQRETEEKSTPNKPQVLLCKIYGFQQVFYSSVKLFLQANNTHIK